MSDDEEMAARIVAEQKAWDDFVSSRPEAWRPLLGAIAKEIGQATFSIQPDGTWRVRADWGLGEVRTVMRAAPRGFIEQNSAMDIWDDQHVESESTTFVHPGHMARIECFDHYAGLTVTLTVYGSASAWDEAMREGEEDDDGVDGVDDVDDDDDDDPDG